jgi:hypothetical protein
MDPLSVVERHEASITIAPDATKPLFSFFNDTVPRREVAPHDTFIQIFSKARRLVLLFPVEH